MHVNSAREGIARRRSGAVAERSRTLPDARLTDVRLAKGRR